MKQILLLIYKDGAIRTRDIGRSLDIPAKSVERYIKQLREAGIIEFRGANRTGGYHLTKKTIDSI